MIFIYWSYGLQRAALNISKLLHLRGLKFSIAAQNLRLKEEALKYFPSNLVTFEESGSASSLVEVENIVSELGAALNFSERFPLANDIHCVEEGADVLVRLVSRAKALASRVVEEQGVFVSEWRSDIGSTLLAICAEHGLCRICSYSGARLHGVDDGLVPFFVHGNSEWPFETGLLHSDLERSKLQLSVEYTKKLFRRGVQPGELYRNLAHENLDIQSSMLGSKAHYLYPMHFFPENSSLGMTLGSRGQRWIIEHLARSLPSGTRLLVKPHFVASHHELFNFKEVSEIPGVDVAAPGACFAELAQNCRGVLSLSSTAILECIYLNIPVLTLTSSFASLVPGVPHFDIYRSSIHGLRGAILRMHSLDVSPYDKAAFLDKLLETLGARSFLAQACDYPGDPRVAQAVASYLERSTQA